MLRRISIHCWRGLAAGSPRRYGAWRRSGGVQWFNYPAQSSGVHVLDFPESLRRIWLSRAVAAALDDFVDKPAAVMQAPNETPAIFKEFETVIEKAEGRTKFPSIQLEGFCFLLSTAPVTLSRSFGYGEERNSTKYHLQGVNHPGLMICETDQTTGGHLFGFIPAAFLPGPSSGLCALRLMVLHAMGTLMVRTSGVVHFAAHAHFAAINLAVLVRSSAARIPSCAGSQFPQA